MIARPVHSGYLVAAMLLAARSLLLLALTFSAMLAVDYSSATPRFCGAEGGCGAVQQSGYAHVLGVSLPVWGLIGLGAFLLLTLSTWRPAVLLARAAGAFAVAAGAGLLGLQVFVLHAVCPFCVVVDVSSAVAGVLVLVSGGASASPPRLRPWAFGLLGALAIAAPLVYPKVAAPSRLPPGIEALQVPGKLTVVEFADFECPFCRHLHPRLSAAVDAQPPGSVAVVRLNVPLPFHPMARGAALAHLCAEAQDEGEAMADRLFRMPSMTPARIREAAVELGLDMEAYDACLTDDATATRLEEEMALFRATGSRGLPMTYIGDQVLPGAQPDEEIARLFDEARRHRGIPTPVFVGVVALLAVVLVVLGRRRPS